MKRHLLWAFALALVVLAGAVGTTFYLTIYRPTKAVMGDLQQLSELRAMNEGIADSGGFQPPGDDLLTAEQVERFARVQASMASELGSDYGVLQDRAMTLEGLVREGKTGSGKENSGTDGDHLKSRPVRVRAAILAFKGLGPVLKRAKDAQIRALNREGFSMAEYRWVRESVYRALGFSHVDRYFEDYAAGDVPNEVPDTEAVPDHPEGPEANRELVASVSNRADDWFPFLVFGL